MREIASGLRTLLADGRPFALAMTVAVRGSSPRPAGAVMTVDADGAVLGSLSAGCVESALYALCEQVLADGQPVVETFGVTAEGIGTEDMSAEGIGAEDIGTEDMGAAGFALAGGLTCGGELDVLVRRVEGDDRRLLTGLLDALDAREPVALATVVGVGVVGVGVVGIGVGAARLGAMRVVTPGGGSGELGAGLDEAVTLHARGLLAAGRDGAGTCGPTAEPVTVFTRVFVPPERLLIFGATDFASTLATLGVFLGYHVTVCDARPVFAVPARFPDAHEVVCAWPHRYLAETALDQRTAICVLTHDPKFDLPLLELALRSPVAYVGAMGSRRTHADRVDRLRERGLSEAELARLRSPIGLDIGARTPQETAMSIAAELVQARHGGTGRPLSTVEGAIHAAR